MEYSLSSAIIKSMSEDETGNIKITFSGQCRKDDMRVTIKRKI